MKITKKLSDLGSFFWLLNIRCSSWYKRGKYPRLARSAHRDRGRNRSVATHLTWKKDLRDFKTNLLLPRSFCSFCSFHEISDKILFHENIWSLMKLKMILLLLSLTKLKWTLFRISKLIYFYFPSWSWKWFYFYFPWQSWNELCFRF